MCARTRDDNAALAVGHRAGVLRSRQHHRHARERNRCPRLVSKALTALVNIISGRRLKYYNGLQIHRADILTSLSIQSSGYGFQAEVLVKALRRADRFIEVGMDLTEREHGESKAFRLKNAV